MTGSNNQKPLSFGDFTKLRLQSKNQLALSEEEYFKHHNKEKAKEASEGFKKQNQKGSLDRLREWFS